MNQPYLKPKNIPNRKLTKANGHGWKINEWSGDVTHSMTWETGKQVAYTKTCIYIAE